MRAWLLGAIDHSTDGHQLCLADSIIPPNPPGEDSNGVPESSPVQDLRTGRRVDLIYSNILGKARGGEALANRHAPAPCP
jgi:hypothetical protein